MYRTWNSRVSCTVLICSLAAGCSGSSADHAPTTEVPVTAYPNQQVLDEVANAQAWFHAKKTRPIWARLLDRDQVVETLEGRESVPAGSYLCRGEANELWPQTAEALGKRYVATDEVDAEGWRKYTPAPDAMGVLAAEIGHPFEIQAPWGLLSGKAGDFVVKNYDDRETAYPKDVWIVDRQLFLATYARVPSDQK